MMPFRNGDTARPCSSGHAAAARTGRRCVVSRSWMDRILGTLATLFVLQTTAMMRINVNNLAGAVVRRHLDSFSFFLGGNNTANDTDGYNVANVKYRYFIHNSTDLQGLLMPGPKDGLQGSREVWSIYEVRKVIWSISLHTLSQLLRFL